jgi:hypothetical protein
LSEREQQLDDANLRADNAEYRVRELENIIAKLKQPIN